MHYKKKTKEQQREINTVHPGNNFYTHEKIIMTYHDKDFNIILANKAAKELLCLPSLIGNKVKCYKYYHGKDSPAEECPSCKCVLTGEPIIFEMYEPHLHKRVQIRAIPQFDENSDFKGMIHIVRDITHESLSSDKNSFK